MDQYEEKVKRFMKDLKIDIKKELVPLNIKDYNEIYERAELMEQELMKE